MRASNRPVHREGDRGMKTEQKEDGIWITMKSGRGVMVFDDGSISVGDSFLTSEEFTAIASVRHGLKDGVNCK